MHKSLIIVFALIMLCFIDASAFNDSSRFKINNAINLNFSTRSSGIELSGFSENQIFEFGCGWYGTIIDTTDKIVIKTTKDKLNSGTIFGIVNFPLANPYKSPLIANIFSQFSFHFLEKNSFQLSNFTNFKLGIELQYEQILHFQIALNRRYFNQNAFNFYDKKFVNFGLGVHF